MKKIKEIIQSYGKVLNHTPEEHSQATERLAVCESCEFIERGPTRCGVCGCLLKGKIYSPAIGACPKGKWDEIDNRYNQQ